MELPERIEKRMKQYGLNTLEEMIQAIDQQEPIDVFSEDVHGTPEEQETTEETSEEGK